MNTVFMGLKLLEGNYISDNSTEKDDDFTDISAILKDVKSATNVALEVLNDMLLLDKITEGILSPEFVDEEPTQFLLETISPFTLQARESQIKFVYHTSDLLEQLTGYIIRIDRSKFAQVIRNLISNALKFTPTGGTVTIDVRAKTEIKMQTGVRSFRRAAIVGPPIKFDTLSINVIDTGVGISAENQHKLFSQIIQFNPGKLQEGGGSGLGLFVSKGLVDLHHGNISVHSDGEGRGCRFSVEIPLSFVELDQRDLEGGNIRDIDKATSSQRLQKAKGDSVSVFSNIRDSSSSYMSIKQASEKEQGLVEGAIVVKEHRYVNPLRILIVDDASSNRKMMGRLLAKHGHVCVEAVDGSDALVKYRASVSTVQLFNLVLMDYQMPVLDGPTAIKAIRNEGYSGIIIGVTGNVLACDKDTMVDAGANSVMEKPFDIDEFYKLLLLLDTGTANQLV